MSYLKLFFLSISLAIVGLLFFSNSSVSAASKEDFSAGNLIDDAVFYNSSSMNSDEIQRFLESKNPQCDYNGTQPASDWGYPNLTHAQFAQYKREGSNGFSQDIGFHAPPYKCLTRYSQNTPQMGAASGYCGSIQAGSRTAAQIINDVAKACNINPQVLIVLLDKEQSLITDNWPLDRQLRNATGFACPDTAPCDPAYEGFFYQVYYAARQFKVYQALPNNYNYIAGRTQTVYYHPGPCKVFSSGKCTEYYVRSGRDSTKPDIGYCGSTQLYIQNQATAALYIYTPYQPNQSALDNLYGSGDMCGAYGNRNFWRIFTDWFGSTKTPSYYWAPNTQMSFTNGSANQTLPTVGRVQGDKVYLIVKVKNSGTATWRKGQVNLALSNPTSRTSAIYDNSWPSKDRPAYFYESSVAPGGEATYGFWANLHKSGTYREYFNLVADGITWMNDMGLYYEFQVAPAKYTGEYQTQATYTDTTKSTLAQTDYSQPGVRYYNVLKIKNTGNITWRKGYINLGTTQPVDRSSNAYDTTWLNKNRIATFSESSVAPGAIATFEFWTKTPPTIGENREYINLVAENISWFTDYGIYFGYKVNKPYEWAPVEQRSFTDQTKSVTKNLSQLTPGERSYLEIRVRNTGTQTWKKGVINLGPTQPTDRISKFLTAEWLSNNRPTTINENSVAPGEIGTFDFWIQAPDTKGEYKEYFNIVAENITWLTDYGLYFPIRVR